MNNKQEFAGYYQYLNIEDGLKDCYDNEKQYHNLLISFDTLTLDDLINQIHTNVKQDKMIEAIEELQNLSKALRKVHIEKLCNGCQELDEILVGMQTELLNYTAYRFQMKLFLEEIIIVKKEIEYLTKTKLKIDLNKDDIELGPEHFQKQPGSCCSGCRIF